MPLSNGSVVRQWECADCELRRLDSDGFPVGNCGCVQEVSDNGSVYYRCSFLPYAERHIYTLGIRKQGIAEVLVNLGLLENCHTLNNYHG